MSELSAIGAPTRALWEWLVAPYTLLVIAFGIGVRISADANRALRITGTLITVHGALGLAWPFAPMHQRETLAAGGSTVSDTLHLVLGAVTVLLMLMAITFAAAAFGKWFRVYSFATLAILFVFGALTFLDAPNIGTNLPTPWVGLWERINIGAFLLWIAVLAVRMLSPAAAARCAASSRARVALVRSPSCQIACA